MEFKWNVVQMDRQSSDGFVTGVHYTVTAHEGSFMASTYGSVGYSLKEDQVFIAFDELTREDVIAWVKHSLRAENIEDSLALQVDAQKNPVQVSGLPW